MVHPGDVVFDVGANVGFYTLLAASRVRPNGTVVAFEPLLENVRYIERHIQMNRVDHVRIVQAAVGRNSGKARFQPHASRAMGRISDSGTMDVDVVALDAFCDARTVPDPTLMKIDVEGAELGVLEGASRMLTRAQPTIFLATHGAEIHRKCCEYLAAIGYTLRPIDETISSIDATDEIIAIAGVADGIA